MVVHSKVEPKLNNVIALSSLQSWNTCSRMTNIRVIYCMCSKCCRLLMAQVAICVEAKENALSKISKSKKFSSWYCMVAQVGRHETCSFSNKHDYILKEEWWQEKPIGKTQISNVTPLGMPNYIQPTLVPPWFLIPTLGKINNISFSFSHCTSKLMDLKRAMGFNYFNLQGANGITWTNPSHVTKMWWTIFVYIKKQWACMARWCGRLQYKKWWIRNSYFL